MLAKESRLDTEVLREAKNEATLLREVSHENVVKLRLDGLAPVLVIVIVCGNLCYYNILMKLFLLPLSLLLLLLLLLALSLRAFSIFSLLLLLLVLLLLLSFCVIVIITIDHYVINCYCYS